MLNDNFLLTHHFFFLFSPSSTPSCISSFYPRQRALVLGSGQEMAIAKLIAAAPSLIRLGIHFGSPTARVKALEALCANADALRVKRTGGKAASAPAPKEEDAEA